MLDIILMILKFLGIGLGILILIALVLLLLVLFVPVRYEANGEKQEQMRGSGKIHWLFRIVSFQVTYENEEVKQVLRIFGVPVWRK